LFLVWPYEIEIMDREKSGEIFCQKHPVKNRRDPFSPKAFCHKRSTRSANGSFPPALLLTSGTGSGSKAQETLVQSELSKYESKWGGEAYRLSPENRARPILIVSARRS